MNRRNRYALLLLTASAAASLAGCGGGGNSSSGAAPPPPPAASYGVSASVTGLKGTLVLRFNDSADVSTTANGTLPLASGLANGSAYKVIVKTQPANPSQSCAVSNGSGTITGANVSDVAIACADVPLTLLDSVPAAGATGIAPDAQIRVRFSAQLAATPPVSNVHLTSAAGAQPVDLSIAGDQLVITPQARLAVLTPYELVIDGGIRGAGDEQPAAPITLVFTSADGAWGSAERISDGNTAAGGDEWPNIAMNSAGDAVGTWEQNHAVWANVYSAARGWRGANMISGSGVTHNASSRGAIDAAGDAIVVWSQQGPDSVWASHYRANSLLGAFWATPINIGSVGSEFPPAAHHPEIAMTPEGDARASWLQNGVAAAYWPTQSGYSPQTGWGTPSRLQSVTLDHSLQTAVAYSTHGNTLFLWTQGGEFGDLEVWANSFTPLGGFEGPVRLETSNGYGISGLQVGLDTAGNGIALWERFDGVRVRINSRRYLRPGWAGVVVIDAADAGLASHSHLAVTPGGDAIAIWSQFDGGRYRILANRFARGAWSVAEPVEDNIGNADYPRIALDAAGNALAVWEQYDGSTSHVWGARRGANGGWQAPVRLEGSDKLARRPRIAIDGAGNAIAVWTQADPAIDSVFANRFR